MSICLSTFRMEPACSTVPSRNPPWLEAEAEEAGVKIVETLQ